VTAGLRGGAQDGWTGVVVRFGDILPPYPDASTIKPPRIPAPPLLQGDTEDQLAVTLLRAYKATALVYYGRYRGKHHSRLRTRDLQAEVRALRALRSSSVFYCGKEVRPHIWCKVAFTTWKLYGPRRFRTTTPPIAWVFHKDRYEKLEWLYVDADEQARGTRVALTRTHIYLIRRYERLKVELIAASRLLGVKLRQGHVENVVDEVLPRRVYRKLVARAREESEQRQMVINDAYEQGDFLWA